jgi:site-specific recombinase XerD
MTTQELTLINEPNYRLKYRGWIAHYSDSSKTVMNNVIKQFLMFLSLNGITINNINQDVINIWLDKQRTQEQNISNSSYNLRVSAISSFLTYLGFKDFVYKRMSITPYEHIQTMNLDVFNNIIGYLEKEKELTGKKQIARLRDYILFKLIFLTGCRKMEIANMRHSDIYQENGAYKYRCIIKGHREVEKEFPAESLLADIQKLKIMENKADSNDYIFTSQYNQKHEHLTPKSIYKILNSYHHKVNKTTENIKPHAIRALSSQVLFEKSGHNLLLVRRHLNHKSIELTRHYIERLTDHKIEYYEQMDGVLK